MTFKGKPVDAGTLSVALKHERLAKRLGKSSFEYSFLAVMLGRLVSEPDKVHETQLICTENEYPRLQICISDSVKTNFQEGLLAIQGC
jgi:hypothetical protein